MYLWWLIPVGLLAAGILVWLNWPWSFMSALRRALHVKLSKCESTEPGVLCFRGKGVEIEHRDGGYKTDLLKLKLPGFAEPFSVCFVSDLLREIHGPGFEFRIWTSKEEACLLRLLERVRALAA